MSSGGPARLRPTRRLRWPRVAQVVLCDAFAGTEQHVAVLSRELSALDARVRVICGDRNSRLIDDVRDAGVEVCPLRLGRGNLPVDWVEAYRAIVGWSPHIVHVHLGSSLLCGALLLRGSQKLVFTQHFIRPAYRDASGLMPTVRALAHRAVHARVDLALAATELVRAEMVRHEGFSWRHTAVVPLGIDVHGIVERADGGDVRAELGLPRHATLLVTPARLEEVKGHQTLLSALPGVLARHPHTYLLLAGSGALERPLRAQAQELGLGDHVLFLGQRADVPRLLVQSALCVLPSYEDSFGLVLLEAMAVGKPVVACDVGGPREIVTDGTTGLLVPPRNPEALAQAIATVLADPEQADRLGAAGRRRVQDHFSARRMAERTLQVYGQVL